MGAPSCTTKRWQICEIRGEKRDAHSTQSRIGANRLSARKITHGGGRGPVAPPVFKTGLAGIAFAGRFDSFPPPPRDSCDFIELFSAVPTACPPARFRYSPSISGFAPRRSEGQEARWTIRGAAFFGFKPRARLSA